MRLLCLTTVFASSQPSTSPVHLGTHSLPPFWRAHQAVAPKVMPQASPSMSFYYCSHRWGTLCPTTRMCWLINLFFTPYHLQAMSLESRNLASLVQICVSCTWPRASHTVSAQSIFAGQMNMQHMEGNCPGPVNDGEQISESQPSSATSIGLTLEIQLSLLPKC